MNSLKKAVSKPDHNGFKGVSLILLFFIFDYLTKLYISNHISLNSGIIVIRGFFNIVDVHNSGIAFGAFAHTKSSFRVLLLSLISIAVFLAVLYLILFGKNRNFLFILGLAFLGGGDLGNLFERLTKGYVVDFLDFHIKQYHYPAFNLADSFITIGITMLIFFKFLEARQKKSLNIGRGGRI